MAIRTSALSAVLDAWPIENGVHLKPQIQIPKDAGEHGEQQRQQDQIDDRSSLEDAQKHQRAFDVDHRPKGEKRHDRASAEDASERQRQERIHRGADREDERRAVAGRSPTSTGVWPIANRSDCGTTVCMVAASSEPTIR
jgi:hypothetical protein